MNMFLPFLGGWFWLVAAGVLLILELLAPGVFFIWLAIAAFFTAIVDRIVDMGWQGELLTFAALSLAAIFLGKPLLRRRHALEGDQPTLNRRMYGYVGQSYVLNQPIMQGRGRLKIDDTLWDVVGPDLPDGTRVTVTAIEGLRLRVEAAKN
jgi:membrane protein implicated in regulation of membrane protease activity